MDADERGPQPKLNEFEEMTKPQAVAEIKRLRRDAEGYQRTLDAREELIRRLGETESRLQRQIKERDQTIAEQARRLERMPDLDERIRQSKTALKQCLSVLNEAHTLVRR